MPNKRRAYMKRCREVAEGVARELVQRQRPAVSAGEGVQRNVLSRLGNPILLCGRMNYTYD